MMLAQPHDGNFCLWMGRVTPLHLCVQKMGEEGKNHEKVTPGMAANAVKEEELRNISALADPEKHPRRRRSSDARNGHPRRRRRRRRRSVGL